MKKTGFSLCLLITLGCILLTSFIPVSAQSRKKYLHDSAYYEMYPGKLTGRIYMAQKLQQFTIPGNGSLQDIKYKANTKLNTGIGVTWHNLTVNAFYGFSFLNKDTAKGKTK